MCIKSGEWDLKPCLLDFDALNHLPINSEECLNMEDFVSTEDSTLAVIGPYIWLNQIILILSYTRLLPWPSTARKRRNPWRSNFCLVHLFISWIYYSTDGMVTIISSFSSFLYSSIKSIIHHISTILRFYSVPGTPLYSDTKVNLAQNPCFLKVIDQRWIIYV